MSRYSSLYHTYGDSTVKTFQSSKILVIGAGGIGCEILKNLAMMGFKYVEIIDLDTIDVSNLNRQFLFRSHHVGLPKALVAAEAVKAFNPEIEIIPHHANVKDCQYGMSYFQRFDVVLNALDNVDARRYVNRMCLAVSVPLIDSGTTGFLGQVMPIIKNKYACYECKPKPTQKVYPICTIRSTPDKPVHCIVWGKELFKLLLGNTQESMLFEDTLSTGEKSTYMGLVSDWYKHSDTDSFINHVSALFVALFHTEIEKRIAMDTYKTASSQPVSVSTTIIDSAATMSKQLLNSVLESTVERPSDKVGWENTIWSIESCFVELFLILHETTFPMDVSETSTSLIGKLSFDKDDELSMKFVFLSSCIRSCIFNIPTLSYHDTKGIAGNIIPAISTTNAIVAGIQVMQAIKILVNRSCELSHVYCVREPTTKKGQYLTPTIPDDPEAGCYVCNKSILQLEVDTSTFLFNDFVNKVLKVRLGFWQPSVIIGSSVIYEEGDADEDDIEFFKNNLAKALVDCPAGGLVNDTSVLISDASQNLDVTIAIKHVAVSELESQENEDIKANLFHLIGGNIGSKAVSKAVAEVSTSSDEQVKNSDDFAIMDEDFMIIETTKPMTSSSDVTDAQLQHTSMNDSYLTNSDFINVLDSAELVNLGNKRNRENDIDQVSSSGETLDAAQKRTKHNEI